MASGSVRGLAAGLAAIGLVVAACGGSTGGTPPPAASVPAATVPAVTTAPVATSTTAPGASVSITAAAPGCPTGATVGTALGISLPAPVGVKGGGAEKLPAGATGISCEYHAASYNVILEILTGVPASFISNYSSRFPVKYTTVSGVGDQARFFLQSLNGGRDNEGVVATKGTDLVDVTATATPASLTQVEALVSQLL
jgi:hypothetical protein